MMNSLPRTTPLPNNTSRKRSRDRRHHQNSKQDHPHCQKDKLHSSATPLRERWEVANGPWRVKQNKPSPRERKRRQQAARRRDKEQTTYWLRRNRGRSQRKTM
jgi:hypothetical protein